MSLGIIDWADKPDSLLVNVVYDAQAERFKVCDSMLGTILSDGPVITTRVKNKYTKTLRALRFTGTNGACYHGRYDAKHADTKCTIYRRHT
jgi:hypothetical protein